PVPSGDRQMARLLVAALRHSGHSVTIASNLRSFSATPDQAVRDAISAAADKEIERLSRIWRAETVPDLWFCYHPYYKAPDLIGPPLAAAFNIPYLTAEASYSRRRDETGWRETQARVVDAVRLAKMNICFTQRDKNGLQAIVKEKYISVLPPFIDGRDFRTGPEADDPHRLMTIAMLRPGDKLESYRMLAAALALLKDRDWTLSVIGDGPARDEIRGFFAGLPGDSIEWLGEKTAGEVTELLRRGGIYVWPGEGEAYGIAYLEAQAAGLPVVAQATAGVPEVVRNGITGLLTPAGDTEAFARAIATLCSDNALRRSMGRAARQFVTQERSLERASQRLNDILHTHAGRAVS
ncbi:MAG: glycosyltransferase family 4 protein, partial [Phyllobacterium sp.]